MSLQGLLTFDRQIAFAASRALNKVALAARDAERAKLRETFTIRNNWPERGPLRVEAKFSSKSSLSAAVVSGADFLARQEKGGTKTPRGRALAIPTSKVRRTKRGLVAKSLRPKNLQGAFVIQGKKGALLVQRTGKKKTLRVLYGLEPSAQITAAPTFFPTVRQVVRQQFQTAFREELAKALASAR